VRRPAGRRPAGTRRPVVMRESRWPELTSDHHADFPPVSIMVAAVCRSSW
jgi:hypothetical protein